MRADLLCHERLLIREKISIRMKKVSRRIGHISLADSPVNLSLRHLKE
jgi:hypothetical protein